MKSEAELEQKKLRDMYMLDDDSGITILCMNCLKKPAVVRGCCKECHEKEEIRWKTY